MPANLVDNPVADQYICDALCAILFISYRIYTNPPRGAGASSLARHTADRNRKKGTGPNDCSGS